MSAVLESIFSKLLPMTEKENLFLTSDCILDGGNIMPVLIDEAGYEKTIRIIRKLGGLEWTFLFSSNNHKLFDSHIKGLHRVVVEEGSAELAQRFIAHVSGLNDVQKVELIITIIKSGDGHMSLPHFHDTQHFEKELQDKIFQEVIISQSPDMACYFSSAVLGLSEEQRDRCIAVVVDARDSKCAYRFASSVHFPALTSVQIDKLCSVAIDAKDSRTAYHFLRYVTLSEMCRAKLETILK